MFKVPKKSMPRFMNSQLIAELKQRNRKALYRALSGN